MSGWTPTQARSARLRSLLLGPHPWRTADEVVTWFGAMQAQDLASALWSLGLRLPGSTEKDMLTALEQRRILRTWPMRGTIHLVPAEDAHWMLGLMGSTMMATSHRRRENLGLTQEDTDRATAALADALSGGRHLTRSQALSTINDAGVTTEGQRGYHLLWYAALTGVTCIGPQVDGEQTFVLLDEWVANPRRLEATRGGRRARLPVLPQPRAGPGVGLRRLDRARASHHPHRAERQRRPAHVRHRRWRGDVAEHRAHRRPRRAPTTAPDGRAAGLRRAHARLQGPLAARPGRPVRRRSSRAATGSSASTIVSDGIVHGTWTRGITAKQVKVTLQPFAALTATRRAAVDRALGAYAQYLGRSLTLTVINPSP